MHENVLPADSLALIQRLEALAHPALAGWTLAGGTGLALYLGHRISADFDFFRTDNRDVRVLHDVFASLGRYQTLQETTHTLTVISHKTKLSFFRIPDPFLFDPTPYRFFHVADARDMALMKLVAISGRGARKDFVDLYSLLQTGITLRQCIEMLPRKYRRDRLNVYHILKSLTYFEDAEAEPMPQMLVPFDWEACKAHFVEQAEALVLE